MRQIPKNKGFHILCPYLFAFADDGNEIQYKAFLKVKGGSDKANDATPPCQSTLIYLDEDDTNKTNENCIVKFEIPARDLAIFEDRTPVGIVVYIPDPNGTGSKDQWWNDKIGVIKENLV